MVYLQNLPQTKVPVYLTACENLKHKMFKSLNFILFQRNWLEQVYFTISLNLHSALEKCRESALKSCFTKKKWVRLSLIFGETNLN